MLLVNRVSALQRGLATIGRSVESVIILGSGALLVFIVAALFLQVVTRYVIKQPLPWTEEGARFALVWYAMLAAGLAARRGLQFVFRWATLPLSIQLRAWLRQVLNVVILAFLIVIMVQSVTYLGIVANQTATATAINMQIPYLGVTIGLGYLSVVYVFDSLDALCSLITKQTLSLREKEEILMNELLAAIETPDLAQ